MATIDIPTPSNPKSPQPDQQPLQPGGPQESHNNSANPQRPNFQSPDTQHEKFGNDEHN
ncbi:MAG: hypothetical protein QOH21_2423 [Acidobacteriota bacterium]|jgi:hypothetical protein|nr:hypothetical protein [Acidobacteriota bacterium]